ncbi:MAG: hypothetical protein K6G15_08000 [Desulfovibrio sp.]|nr:hypothetical protein [Desulfovibrio sp.]
MPIESTYSVATPNELEASQVKQTNQSSKANFAELLTEAEQGASVETQAETAVLGENGKEASCATETLALQTESASLEEESAAKSQELEKPCIAQFMVMTGCDFKTATKALYQYENWQDYLTKDNSSIPELSQAQQQLQAERESGERSMVNGSYGARADYVKPDPPQVDTPGEVIPLFDQESGKVAGLAFYDAQGTEKTTASLTDRETILEHTDGFHIGRIALDNFAQKATGEETARFDDLDLTSLAQNFPSYTEWTAQFGLEGSVNGRETLAAQAESNQWLEDEEDTGLVETTQYAAESAELAELTQKAELSLLMNDLA